MIGLNHICQEELKWWRSPISIKKKVYKKNYGHHPEKLNMECPRAPFWVPSCS
jgi:hypothetical protein